MDIRQYYLANLGRPPYPLVNYGTGSLVTQVTETESEPYYLGWFGDDLSASIDVHQIQKLNGIDYIFCMGDHQVKRADLNSSWTTVSAQNYVSNNPGGSGYPMFPVNLNPGDTGEVESNGTWTWTVYNADGSVASTGSGTWTDKSIYELTFNRFHWEEIYSETHKDTGQVVPYHRILTYDNVSGFLGFKDVVDGTYIVRPGMG